MKEWVSFVERLYFIDVDGRVTAVMAYSENDAIRQYRELKFLELYTIFMEAA